MINKDGGGGQFFNFMGGHRAHGGPPTRENPALRLSYLEKNVVEETLNFR